MISRSEIKTMAKEQLRGNWGIAILAFLIYAIIISSSGLEKTIDGIPFTDSYLSPYYGLSISINIIALLLGGLVSVGISKFSLNLVRHENVSIGDLFSNFNIYLKTLGLYLLMGIAICIGLILFIIPGIILSLMFSQAYYILSEDNEKSIIQCLEESSRLMKGYKWDYFVLELSFIGWWIIALITCGIGALWVTPYQGITEANYYMKLKEESRFNKL